MEQRLLGHPQTARPPTFATRTAALVLVGLVSAVLALGAAWSAARFVVVQWNLGNPAAIASGTTLERDLLAFGTALPSYAAVAAAGVIVGLAGLEARERWEGVITMASLLLSTLLGLVVTIS